jgi:glycosyltransferase involved in cell wall biosynthesis
VRVAVDFQIIANGNRSGLYTALRSVLLELRPLVRDEFWLVAQIIGKLRRTDAPTLSAAMGGLPVRLVKQPPRFYRLWHHWSSWNRVDVLLHNLHGLLPPATKGANAYLVPDVIPLAVNYGSERFADHYLPFYRAAAQHGDVILTFSEHGKRDFLERIGGSPDRIRAVPLAAGPEFAPRPRETLRAALAAHGLDATPYVLMVATLEVRKNHEVLLRAFARLRQRDPALPHRLVLVGTKWIGHERVFELIDQLGLQDRVSYLGFAEDLPALYAGADAFVFPSIYEGFGLPPLEAMACGVPVLSANATSLPEVVGTSGILFEPHDFETLAGELHRVLVDRAHHADLSARGLARAAMFSWKQTAAAYLAAFEAAAARRAGEGS